MTIHSKDCVNVNASHDPARWVEAEWNDNVNSSYNGSIQILAQDRHNLLADLMSYLSAQKVTVCALNAKVNSNQTCSIELTLQVANQTGAGLGHQADCKAAGYDRNFPRLRQAEI